MTRQIPTPVAVVAVVAAVLAAVWVVGSTKPPGVGTAPEIAGTTTAGETFRLSDHKGEVVLVNFWATWCGPCQMEIPEMNALQKRFGPRGFRVVGLSLDAGGMAVVRPFAERAGMDYTVLPAPEGVQTAFGGVPANPASFLIDKNGNVAHEVVGLVSQEQLAPQIEKLLK